MNTNLKDTDHGFKLMAERIYFSQFLSFGDCYHDNILFKLKLIIVE
jgi:hypothetical protein